MKALRRLGFALWLALALVAGQHAAMLHDLGHASEKLADKQGSKPAPTKCGECFACAQLVGGAPATAPSVPPVSNDIPVFAFHEQGTFAAPVLAYRSQAPPALL
jgi:hypothetical protein